MTLEPGRKYGATVRIPYPLRLDLEGCQCKQKDRRRIIHPRMKPNAAPSNRSAHCNFANFMNLVINHDDGTQHDVTNKNQGEAQE